MMEEVKLFISNIQFGQIPVQSTSSELH